MKIYDEIKDYLPFNEQEENDRKLMLKFMENNDDFLERSNETAHFTASIWTLNRERTKTLMVYHKIYDSWSWIGGHADGEENLREVAMRELKEETGAGSATLISEDIFSLEILAVQGHFKKGIWIPSHSHLNLTFIAEADENEETRIAEEENSAVKWWDLEACLRVSDEPWMVEHIYKKLIDKHKQKGV